MIVTWAIFKSLVDTKSLSIQYVDLTESYYLKLFDGLFNLDCVVNKDGGADQTDFEANYKTVGNKALVTSTAVQALTPFGAKTLNINGVIKKLFARNTGMQFAVVTGSNTLTYTMTYAWAKLLGAEIVNCEALDTINFKVYDNAAGTYSGYPNALLNQFGYTVNLPKDFYQRVSPYDSDVYVGMVMQLTYVSASNKTIGVNLLLNEVKT